MLLPTIRRSARFLSQKDLMIPSIRQGWSACPDGWAIVRANQYMVEHSTYLIAYVSHPSSGSREVLEDALRRQRRGLIHVINLAGWYPI